MGSCVTIKNARILTKERHARLEGREVVKGQYLKSGYMLTDIFNHQPLDLPQETKPRIAEGQKAVILPKGNKGGCTDSLWQE